MNRRRGAEAHGAPSCSSEEESPGRCSAQEVSAARCSHGAIADEPPPGVRSRRGLPCVGSQDGETTAPPRKASAPEAEDRAVAVAGSDGSRRGLATPDESGRRLPQARIAAPPKKRLVASRTTCYPNVGFVAQFCFALSAHRPHRIFLAFSAIELHQSARSVHPQLRRRASARRRRRPTLDGAVPVATCGWWRMTRCRRWR